MAWRLEGTYFESCSCDEVCPCTWSAFTAKATLDRCRALLAYHVESGEVDGVDVSGLTTWCSIGLRASSGGVVMRLAGDARLPGGGAVGHQ